jgi:hypothetical protein
MSVHLENIDVFDPADGAGQRAPTDVPAQRATISAVDAAIRAADPGARIADGCFQPLVQRNPLPREINCGGGRSANRS